MRLVKTNKHIYKLTKHPALKFSFKYAINLTITIKAIF